MKITGTIGSGTSTFAGDSGAGQIVIVYSSASILEFALAPNAGTDPNGNAYGAGYTGPVGVFNPVTPTTVEGWHNATLLNGWTNQGFSRYKLIGYNLMLLEVQINDSSATAGTFMNMPTGYTASQGQFATIGIFNNVGGAPKESVAIVQINIGANGALTVLSWAKQSLQYMGNIFISLD
jgi:hypothetical protein